MNGVWQNYQLSLEDFNSPSSIESIVLQNDSGDNLLMYFDQIEFVPDENTLSPIVVSEFPSSLPSIYPSDKPSPIVVSEFPSSMPSIYPSDKPSPIVVSEFPSSLPSMYPSNKPSPIVVSGSPSALPSKLPSLSPQAIPSCESSCVSIYGDSLESGWTAEYSYKCSYDLTYASDAASGSSTSIRVSYNRWGGLFLKPSFDISTNGLSSLQFWMKGQAAGHEIRVRVNKKKYSVFTSAAWELITIPLSEFSNPSMIEKLKFQNRSKENRVILLDEVRIV